MKKLLTLLALAMIPLTSCQSKATPYPEEVGPATFLKDFDHAAAESVSSKKPIFAFFQEVPG